MHCFSLNNSVRAAGADRFDVGVPAAADHDEIAVGRAPQRMIGIYDKNLFSDCESSREFLKLEEKIDGGMNFPGAFTKITCQHFTDYRKLKLGGRCV